jgi:hypothetical protein
MTKKKLLRKPKIEGPKLKKGAKPKPNWTLYEEDGGREWGLSYSNMTKFVNCRERFRLRTVEGLTPTDTKEALNFGTIFHKGLELHALGYTRTQILREFRKKTSKRRKKAEVYDPYQCQIVATMLPYYSKFWGSVLNKMNYIESEGVFEMRYRCSIGRTVVIRGKRDEGFLKDGKLWLQENKTMGQVPEDKIMRTIHVMLQPMIYLMSFLEDYPETPLGGIIYNVIRRPLLKQKKGENDKQFLDRLSKDIESRPEHYFKMFEIPIEQKYVTEWVVKYFDPLICHICLWWESIRHNPFDPWTTPVKNLSGLVGLDPGVGLVPNPFHYARPFGVYDPMTNGLGDYFSRVLEGHDAGLIANQPVFPELDD